MLTSNFANNARYELNGISISRYPAWQSGFKGPEFTPLMPPAGLLKAYKEKRVTWVEYQGVFLAQLGCLNPEKVLERLYDLAIKNGAQQPILLCHESAKTLDSNPCHRRIVAGWLQDSLGVEVPEWSKDEQEGVERSLEEMRARAKAMRIALWNVSHDHWGATWGESTVAAEETERLCLVRAIATVKSRTLNS